MTLTFLAATGPAKSAWKEDDFDDLDLLEEEEVLEIIEENESLVEENATDD